MKSLAPLALLLALGALSHAQANGSRYPAYVTLPKLPVANGAVEAKRYGQMEFVLREKTDVKRGRIWLGYLEYAAQWGDDRRNALAGIVKELEKGGWQVELRDEPRRPPLATLKYEKDGKTAWAIVEIFDQARVAVLEPAGPGVTLVLEAPGAARPDIASDADIPFLKRFPGSRLVDTSRDAQGGMVKSYEAPREADRLEVVAVYRDALRNAGWDIVEERAAEPTGDPSVTARYAKDGVDLWARVHAGETYSLAVGSQEPK